MTDTKKGNKAAILIIDDEEVVRIMFQNFLEGEGFQVLLAEDGAKGFSMMQKFKPPVAVVDKNLPDISGLDFIATQKKRYPNTEFIMITGYSSLETAVQAMKAGAFSYLPKPFDSMTVVLERIRAALRIHELRTCLD